MFVANSPIVLEEAIDDLHILGKHKSSFMRVLLISGEIDRSIEPGCKVMAKLCKS